MEPVETTDPDGVDYGWVMQTTFVLTIIIGAPVVTLLSLGTTLSTWEARAGFAIRVGAVIWILTALSVFGYARWSDTDADANADTDTNGTDTDAVSPPLASSRTHTKTRSDQDQDRDSHANTDTGASQTTQQSSDATRTADAEETS